MRAVLLLAMCIGAALLAPAAFADDRPEQFDFEFSYTNPTGGTTDIADDAVMWFPLELTMPPADPDQTIVYLELEVTGLSHDAPMDLNFILLDPFGTMSDPLGSGLEIMDDAGSFGTGFELTSSTLLFADKGIPLPHTAGEGPIMPFPDTIYRPDGPGTFSQFYGRRVGTDPWYMVIIDDAKGESGSFQTVTLRGVVPEPATLALLAFGAVAVLRRGRR